MNAFKKYRVPIVLAGVAIAGVLYWQLVGFGVNGAVQYKTAKIDRGQVIASVSASGTINPVSSVSVGSQVSGQMKEVLADYNTEVRANQVIARIDPEIFEYRVRQAQADLDSARAQLLVAQSTLSARRADISRAEVNLIESKSDAQRKQTLFDKQFISNAERDKANSVVRTQAEDVKTAQAQLEVAQAQISSAQSTVAQRQAGLDSARADLAKTVIRSPVDGIVIKRSIEVGQTVAASLQAPELFVIAKNLRDMQVDTAVDESDIGKISQGMKATFTVDSFPGRTFEGVVTQVRKAAQTVQNVVTYTVVVGFSNGDDQTKVEQPKRANITSNKNVAASKLSNAPSTPQPANTAASPSAQGVKALRERLEQALHLPDIQKKQLDSIFASQRDVMMAARELPPEQRAAASQSNREQLREKISAILTPDQLKTYQTLLAEQERIRSDAAPSITPAATLPNASTSLAAKVSRPAFTGGAAPSLMSTASLLLPGMTANVRFITAQKNDTLRLPAAALRFKPVTDKANIDKAATSSQTTGAAVNNATNAAPGAAGGGALRAARERLEQAIVPTPAQQKQLDDIYSGMRDKFMSLRDLAEADRPKAMAGARADLQGKIMTILTPEQKIKYEALLAESVAQRAGSGASTRGAVYIVVDGKPKLVNVTTGVSDGSYLELIQSRIATDRLVTTDKASPNDKPDANPISLKEGDEVIVGTVNPSAAKPSSAGPRSPF